MARCARKVQTPQGECAETRQEWVTQEESTLHVDQHAPILPPFVRDFWFRFDPAAFFRIRRVLSQMLVKRPVAVHTQYTVTSTMYFILRILQKNIYYQPRYMDNNQHNKG
jgi:hypothetical protein